MFKYINIHTHSSCKNNNICIQSIHFSEVLISSNVNQFYSIGLHPWDITENNSKNYLISIQEKVKNKQIVAIGEIGLDKAISTDFPLQKNVFLEQLLLAESLQLPVVIHCVRAYSDILHILKKEKISIPIIFHDFRANQQIFNQLLKYNSYFSFGSVLFSAKAKIVNYFNEIPLERIFFETDDSDITIENVYLQAAKLRNIGVGDLKQGIYKNYKSV